MDYLGLAFMEYLSRQTAPCRFEPTHPRGILWQCLCLHVLPWANKAKKQDLGKGMSTKKLKLQK